MNEPNLPTPIVATSSWPRYAERHRLVRITEFPAGVEAPRKVRLYRRADHYMLQWWDPAVKKTLAERVDGDLIDALGRAREVDRRLTAFKSSGAAPRRVNQDDLVRSYLEDLQRRANAGEIDAKSAERYATALTRHYLPFVEQPDVNRRYRAPASIDRTFELEFSQFLQSRNVSPNGHANAQARPMRGQAYVVDTVRAMLQWAADPERGRLLPAGFHNPFAKRKHSTREVSDQGLSEPDVTMPMAVDLLLACDAFQLPLFATLTLYGLRPAELGWIFRADLDDQWLRVKNYPELDYFVKGRRDKQFPVLPCVSAALAGASSIGAALLFQNRKSLLRTPPLGSESMEALVEEFRRRRQRLAPRTAASQQQLRDGVVKEAGQLTYDRVKTEFDKLSRKLGWPKQATLKDFRHLFATGLENAAVPESYRQFLMGHSPGRRAIVKYTHLNQLREHFQRAMDTEFRPIVEAVTRRVGELDANRAA